MYDYDQLIVQVLKYISGICYLADLCEIIKIPLSSDLMPEDFQCQEDLWKPRTKLKQEAF